MKKTSTLSHTIGNRRVPQAEAAVDDDEETRSLLSRPSAHNLRVKAKQKASANCPRPTAAYPHRHAKPAPITLVMISGPLVVPTPNDACSQLTVRALKRVAANVFNPASIAPAPKPESAPNATTIGQTGARAYPIRLVAVARQLIANSEPTLKRESKRPLLKLEIRYPAAPVTSRAPSASTGCLNVARIEGQATPINPSGKPMLMKPA